MNKVKFLTCANVISESGAGKSQFTSRDPLLFQDDLMRVVSVLLSVGINRNKDVFLAEEVIPIISTGAHKPVDLEHKPENIVGHIVKTYAANKNGKILDHKKLKKNDKFNVIAEYVLYKYMFPELCEDLIDKAVNRQLFVSVEAWFTHWDYLVGKDIVKRNQATASKLDPLLKVHGGPGEYNGLVLGRVLRNMIIGAVGIVQSPANPNSITLSVSNFNSENVYNIEDESICENIICQLSDLDGQEPREDVMIRKEIIDQYSKVVAAIYAAEASTNSDNPDNSDINEDSLTPEVKALMDRLTVLEEDNKALKCESDRIRAERMVTERAKKLEEIGISDDIVEEKLSFAFTLPNDVFEKCISAFETIINKNIENDENKEDSEDLNKSDSSENEEVVESKDSPESKQVDSPEGGDVVTVDEKETSVENEVNEVKNNNTEEVSKQEDVVENTDSQKDETVQNVDEKESQNVNNDEQDTSLDEETVNLDNLESIDPKINDQSDDSGEGTLLSKMEDMIKTMLEDSYPKIRN